MIAKKLSIAVGVMYKLKHYIPNYLLKTIYYSIAYPHITYSITTWGSATNKYIKKIQVQQNRIVRILSKCATYRKISPYLQ